jgi:hypothetical protein
MSTAAIIMAMLLAAAIPSGATSGGTIPYIEIEYPQDGSNVGTQETLAVHAEGSGLHSPWLSVWGENIGFEGPLEGCIFSPTYPPTPAGEEPINTSIETMEMYCKQRLDLSSFEGQKVRVSVSVKEETGLLTDSVGLYVSGDGI